MRKGDITLKILDAIEHFTFGASDLFGAFLDAGYGASYGKMQYKASKRRNNDYWFSREAELKRKAKQRYNDLIYRLKRDNLIEEKLRSSRKIFTLTNKGKNKLSLLRDKNKKMLPGFFIKKKIVKDLLLLHLIFPK